MVKIESWHVECRCRVASECLGGARPRRNQKETLPSARRPCCGPPRVLKFPLLLAVPFRIYCCLHTPTCACVRKCLPRRGRCITTERWLDPPPSRHAETLQKSPLAGFHCAGWTGPVAVQRAIQRPTAIPTRMAEAALGPMSPPATAWSRILTVMPRSAAAEAL